MNPEAKPEAKPSVLCSDLLSALADKCDQRAVEWSDTGMYRDREMCDNIATMLFDLAKDLRSLRGQRPRSSTPHRDMSDSNSTDKPEAKSALAASAGSAAQSEVTQCSVCGILVPASALDYSMMHYAYHATSREGLCRSVKCGPCVPVTPNDQDQPRPTVI